MSRLDGAVRYFEDAHAVHVSMGARAFNDSERAGRIQVEIDFLSNELARGVGLGGRSRKSASHVERPRLLPQSF